MFKYSPLRNEKTPLNSCMHAPTSTLDFSALLQHGQGSIRMDVHPPILLKVLDALHRSNPMPPLYSNAPVHREPRTAVLRLGRLHQRRVPSLNDVPGILRVAIVVVVCSVFLECLVPLPQDLPKYMRLKPVSFQAFQAYQHPVLPACAFGHPASPPPPLDWNPFLPRGKYALQMRTTLHTILASGSRPHCLALCFQA